MKDHGWNISFLLATLEVSRQISVLILILQLIDGTVRGQPQGKGASAVSGTPFMDPGLAQYVGWLAAATPGGVSHLY